MLLFSPIHLADPGPMHDRCVWRIDRLDGHVDCQRFVFRIPSGLRYRGNHDLILDGIGRRGSHRFVARGTRLLGSVTLPLPGTCVRTDLDRSLFVFTPSS